TIARFYSYTLDEFIDRAYLWRIDAKTEELQAIAAELHLTKCETAPGEFWTMPPYYWPRRLASGTILYSTGSFPADHRAPDGRHFFMLIDAKHGRGFVWVQVQFFKRLLTSGWFTPSPDPSAIPPRPTRRTHRVS